MPATGEFKICSFCKERIRAEAIKCRFCGEWLEQPPHPNPAPPREANSPVLVDSTSSPDAPQNRERVRESSESPSAKKGEEPLGMGELRGWFRLHDHSLTESKQEPHPLSLPTAPTTTSEPTTTKASPIAAASTPTWLLPSSTRYRVEYRGQDLEASEIEAHSPEEAAKLFLERDSERRHEDYGEIRVFWGSFGRNHQSFEIKDVLPLAVLPLKPTSTAETQVPAETIRAAIKKFPILVVSSFYAALWTLTIFVLDVLRGKFSGLFPDLYFLPFFFLAALVWVSVDRQEEKGRFKIKGWKWIFYVIGCLGFIVSGKGAALYAACRWLVKWWDEERI